jgi:hypothetical protein
VSRSFQLPAYSGLAKSMRMWLSRGCRRRVGAGKRCSHGVCTLPQICPNTRNQFR